jgi:hypothetical protein
MSLGDAWRTRSRPKRTRSGTFETPQIPETMTYPVHGTSTYRADTFCLVLYSEYVLATQKVQEILISHRVYLDDSTARIHGIPRGSEAYLCELCHPLNHTTTIIFLFDCLFAVRNVINTLQGHKEHSHRH